MDRTGGRAPVLFALGGVAPPERTRVAALAGMLCLAASSAGAVTPPSAEPSWLSPAILILILAIAVLLSTHYFSLRRTVRRRTEDLHTTIRDLEAANRELERLARLDSMTGIPNRQSFYEQSALEIERFKRYGRPLSLILFDIDGFKQINDQLGHIEGDAVLRSFAQDLTSRLRAADVFARLGGDEFVALLPETEEKEAITVAERVLRELQQRAFDHGGQSLTLSFSAGVAEFANDNSIDNWIRRADTRLYRSKQRGGGRVSGSQHEPKENTS